MNRLPPLLLLLALVRAPLAAAPDPVLDAVARADDARVAATVAADRSQLAAIFSDDLSYTHSSGHHDTKASYTESIAGGSLKYLSITYEERTFAPAAPGIVLMRGRGHFRTMDHGKLADNYLCFLGVWRLENGAWRFLAWQSCHLPPAKS